MTKIVFFLSLILFTNSTFAKEYIVEIQPGLQASPDLLKITKRKFKALDTEYLVVESDQESILFNSYLEIASVDENFDVYTVDNIDQHQQAQDDFYKTGQQSEFHKQWALQNNGNNEPVSTTKMSPLQGVVGADLNMLKTWDLTKGKKDVVIAVIDTGVKFDHIELKENMWVNQAEKNGRWLVDDDGNGIVDDVHGYDAVQNDGKPQDANGHGTHCAGIIGASHTRGKIMGAMANVSIMAVRMMDKNGRGTLENAIKAVGYAIDNGAHILSNSWGSRGYSEILEKLLVKANQMGIAVVAAAGNSRFNNNDDSPTYPANYNSPNVISVMAYNAQERHAAYSSYGPKTVHVAAPGTNILSTYILKRRWSKEKYRVASGTSMATPYVAAMLGLYMSYHGHTETPEQLKNKLIQSSVPAKDLDGKSISNGRVDAFNFLNL
jgi:thermitase